MSMLKFLLIGSQFIGLIFMNSLYMPKGVIIEHDVPASTIVGSEHWVYVKLEKKKVSGFAKYQIDVPQGIQIEPGDLRGASFTFAEGSAKIIWMSLPQEDEFQISFKMTIYDDCRIGNNTIKQRFAYLDKNARKVVDVPDHTLFVDGENISNEYVPDTLANGTRTITELNADHFLVQIDLYKDGIKGFAKIEETIPAGMNAEAVKKSNAVFTQIDDKVKFVWFSIPEEDSLHVVYEIFAESSEHGEFEVDGEFTYLRNNESKTAKLKNITKEMSSEEMITEAIADSMSNTVEELAEIAEIPEPVTEVEPEEIVEEVVETPVEEVPEEIIEEVVEAVTEVVPEEVVEEAVETPEIEEFQEVTNIPSPDTGVSYKVQIAAGKNVVDAAYFEKRHSFSEAFNIETYTDWIKYTTGDHDVYREARDQRDHINNNFNFDGPFVTAYNDGNRITVQEALMITRQKWYQ